MLSLLLRNYPYQKWPILDIINCLLIKYIILVVYCVKVVIGILVTIECFDTGDQVMMFLCNSSKEKHFCYIL